MNAVGAHIYAGGFSLGVIKHFNVLAHLEHDGYGAEVVKLNFPGLPVYTGGPGKWPRSWDEPVSFMYANPPCAIWSSASKNKAHDWHKDPRLEVHNDVFNYAMDVVDPEVLVIESVPQSLTRGRRHVDELAVRAERYGYALTCLVHNAKWLGVAQSRRRIFYTFHKVVIPWETPDFKHTLTARDALNGAGRRRKAAPPPPVDDLIEQLLERTAPGGKLRHTFHKYMPEPEISEFGLRIGAPSFLWRRLAWDQPAPVPFRLYHPEENRQLTVEEIAALCSFPRSYKWPKRHYDALTGYINRGIMPKAGEWLAEQVRKALEAGQRINDLTPVIIDIASPPSKTYTLASLPQPKEPLPPPAPIIRPKVTGYPPRRPGEGSGVYMQRLLQTWTYRTDMILEAVHAQYPGSKAVGSDVSWNRGKLKQRGEEHTMLRPPARKRIILPDVPPLPKEI